jgi:ElaB/YqjD/DUF883 family membrane-anchored ribosome-binding protein
MATATFEIQDRIDAARESVKQAKRDAEEFKDEAVYRIKKYPLTSIGVAAGVGAGIGLVLGLAAGRCLRG